VSVTDRRAELEQELADLDQREHEAARERERLAVEENRRLAVHPDPDMALYNEDCISGMPAHLAAESVGLTVTSIPFSNLFAYSGKNEDVGNSWDGGTDSRETHFGLHLRFWTEQVLRVTKPGSILAIHIQQLLTTKVQHGHMGRRDFRGAVIDVVAAGGFVWTGEIVIPKNPQAIAQRQKLHSLLFVTAMRDGRKLAPAVNDYILIFQKPGDGVPVPCLYDAERNPRGWLTRNEWIRDAKGLWSDIQETDILEGSKGVRDPEDEKHVAPLQLEVIRRLIRLYSNPGDLVLDPFVGIGSTAYVALEQGRRAVGFELKESYHRQALKNAAKARQQREETASPAMPGLFDSLEAAG
jgi:DNA modification methylase